jgi:hypothetical protein
MGKNGRILFDRPKPVVPVEEEEGWPTKGNILGFYGHLHQISITSILSIVHNWIQCGVTNVKASGKYNCEG